MIWSENLVKKGKKNIYSRIYIRGKERKEKKIIYCCENNKIGSERWEGIMEMKFVYTRLKEEEKEKENSRRGKKRSKRGRN